MPESAMGRLWRSNPLWPSNPPPTSPTLTALLLKGKSRQRSILHARQPETFPSWDENRRASRMEGKRTKFYLHRTCDSFQNVQNRVTADLWRLPRSQFWPFFSGFWWHFFPRGLEFGSTMRRSEPWKENMDFARKVWLFLLLKPEELHSGNDAVKLTVSHVSIFCTESSCGCKNI